MTETIAPCIAYLCFLAGTLFYLNQAKGLSKTGLLLSIPVYAIATCGFTAFMFRIAHVTQLYSLLPQLFDGNKYYLKLIARACYITAASSVFFLLIRRVRVTAIS
ncbi:hypothetical protein IM792_09310 [Mucilaginibacter sp. JRF]|uniref:hypothetical protein n=1 Tax=Mucilaginibacter sp. JRF TaxID=2780088 RepID=UPI00187EE9D4|nr:hypothetical protein [Mucilaginibacter sp. JRF]MBE9584642.1 hypothetical protein [Mucilaginibacter sp. JRF]